MSDTLGAGTACALARDDGVIVSVTVDAKPPAQPPPPKAAPPPTHHVPGTQPPAHHPHGPLASTGLPAIQLLLLAAVVVALGVLLIRVARPSTEVGNA